MNIKQALELKNANPKDTIQIDEFYEAICFLECDEKYKPLVAALEKIANALPPNALSMVAGKILKGYYRKEILGEQ